MEKSKGSRVWLPGREFIGSTPWDDPQGTAAGTDWRWPDIQPSPNQAKSAVGLAGTVDENDSIVHLYPRMRASLVCKDNPLEACMGAEGGEQGKALSCECAEEYGVGCECEEPAVPMYFACVPNVEGADYDLEGMPCTRHMHCKPDGKCAGQPTCREKEKTGTWKTGRKHASGTPCWVDDDCSVVAGKPWCGYHLFNFDDRTDTGTKAGVITLDAKIASGGGGGRKRRGVCSKKGDKSCNNGSSFVDCAAGEGECRGYTLEAQGKK